MRIWLIVIVVGYALMSFVCETDRSQELGSKDSPYTHFIGYEDYGLTSD